MKVTWRMLTAGLGAAVTALSHRHDRRREGEELSASALAQNAAANQMRDHLIASASHDLKSPLASIRLLAHLIKRDATQDSLDAEQVRERVALIEANVNKMASMIGELLDVAHLQSGNPIELRPEETDLVALTTKVVDSFEPDAGKHRITVDAPVRPLVGTGDAGRLERVIAIQHKPRRRRGAGHPGRLAGWKPAPPASHFVYSRPHG